MTKILKEPDPHDFLLISESELRAKYPNLSNEDFDFYFPKKKILDVKIDFISVRKYESLVEKQRQVNNFNYSNPLQKPQKLSEIELNQIKSFEEKKQPNENGFKNEIEYWDKTHDNSLKNSFTNDGLVPDKQTLYKLFLIAYKHLNQVDYILTNESIKNLEPIIKYFAHDQSFSDCENLVKNCGGKKNLQPSFFKGLLLIGNVGNGKTSVMKTMEVLINHYFKLSVEEKWKSAGDWQRIYFKFKTTEELVSEFEYLKTQEEKDIFFKNQSKGSLFLDDLNREKNASNYGITNVIASILEKRYNNLKNYTGENIKKRVTHGTMNYHDDYPNDVDFAIQGCGVRYGSHVRDRIFEMFNIIEFKGKSFRK